MQEMNSTVTKILIMKNQQKQHKKHFK